MGLPIFSEPSSPVKHTSKTNTDPTAYSRSIIRRPRGRFDEEASGSAARALTSGRRHPVGSLQRYRTIYGSNESFDESRLPPIPPPAANGDAESTSSPRPRSRRGLPSSSSPYAEDEIFPPLRRMTGRSPLRTSQGPPEAPRRAADVNGLGDRERSVSVDPPDWNPISPAAHRIPRSPRARPMFVAPAMLSSFESRRSHPESASDRTASFTQPSTEFRVLSLTNADTEELMHARFDPDGLICEDPDLPISNARDEPAEIGVRHRETMTMLRETVDLLHRMEARLGNLHPREFRNGDILTILQQMEELARRVEAQDRMLRASLRNTLRDTAARAEGTRGREGNSDNGIQELGRL